MRRIAVITIASLTFLAGCATPVATQKTSLEIQAIQSKTFEVDKKIAFNSVMSVFQDLGYIIGSASLETGFITAESPNRQDTSGQAVMAALFAGVRTEQKSAVTAAVEELRAGTTRVRLNFVTKQRRSGQYGQSASDDKPIDDPKVYENAFDKIGEAIFIRKASN